MPRAEMFEYFEMQGDSFVIFDVDAFREKTKALAINTTVDGVCILDGESLEWYYLPFVDRKKRTVNLHPVK